jgi:23S rRNA (guanosine2251-2'-O)-methyltransferase
MVQSNKKRKDKNKLAGNHNKSWIWGRHAVLEILEAGRWPIQELVLSDALDADTLSRARDLADALGVQVKTESPDRLRELARTTEHQGLIAKMKPFQYASMDTISDLVKSKQKAISIAVLDRIQDPQNFGAIVRSAEVLGIDAVLISDTHQAEVTPAVARASAGAVNHIPILRVSDLATAAAKLKEMGFTLLGATEKGESLSKENFDTNRIGIVLGNEGDGISPELLDSCDTHIQIPQQGKIESLNVAAAAAILFYEAARGK